ncbi:MAG: cobalt-precorrin-5B (C(1))-methyltransferase, partial [Methanosarcinales archaeon]
KYAGDHEFDITNGIEIVAHAYTSKLIKIIAGDGIGIKDNKPAISPTAWNQIYSAISEALQITQETGAEVYLEVPSGAEMSHKTQNEKVGVIGGISILGTTGFVEPWNDSMDKLINERIKNADKIVLTTGHLGIKYSRALFPDYTVIMVGSRLEKALQWTCDKEVIICGLPGLILKSTNPDLLKRTTLQELMQNSELIDTALANVVKGANRARVILLNKDGSILRDTKPNT